MKVSKLTFELGDSNYKEIKDPRDADRDTESKLGCLGYIERSIATLLEDGAGGGVSKG